MTAQTKGVDVLAWLDIEIERAFKPYAASVSRKQELINVRAAISELIEAAKGMRAVTGGGSVCTVTESLAAYRRLDAALVRCGSQS